MWWSTGGPAWWEPRNELRMTDAMKRDVALWTGILLGPTLWFISFGANFALAWWACIWNWKPALYVISFVALAITAGGGVLAWSLWQRVGREYPGEAGGALPRARVLAIGGVLMSALFFLVILSQGVPEVILGACQ